MSAMSQAHNASERRLVLFIGVLAVALFAAMPLWRDVAARAQGRPLEAFYTISAADFSGKVEAMIAQYGTGQTEDGAPVVRPPPGDVYLLLRRFQYYPVLELEAGRTYRLHVYAEDVQHGFTLVRPGRGAELHRLIAPGRAAVVAFDAGAPGKLALSCSDYCGIGHNSMRASLYVTDLGAK